MAKRTFSAEKIAQTILKTTIFRNSNIRAMKNQNWNAIQENVTQILFDLTNIEKAAKTAPRYLEPSKGYFARKEFHMIVDDYDLFMKTILYHGGKPRFQYGEPLDRIHRYLLKLDAK